MACRLMCEVEEATLNSRSRRGNTLQFSATHCNTLQHTATQDSLKLAVDQLSLIREKEEEATTEAVIDRPMSKQMDIIMLIYEAKVFPLPFALFYYDQTINESSGGMGVEGATYARVMSHMNEPCHMYE